MTLGFSPGAWAEAAESVLSGLSVGRCGFYPACTTRSVRVTSVSAAASSPDGGKAAHSRIIRSVNMADVFGGVAPRLVAAAT